MQVVGYKVLGRWYRVQVVVDTVQSTLRVQGSEFSVQSSKLGSEYTVQGTRWMYMLYGVYCILYRLLLIVMLYTIHVLCSV